MSESPQTFRIIHPDSRIAEGPLRATKHLGGEIWQFRSHIWIVFKEQFRLAYHGASLGVLWNYVLPIIPLSVYLLLSRLRFVPGFDGVDSAVYITFGVTLWLLFAGCIQTPIQMIQSRNQETMKTSFPLSAAVISGFGKLVFETLVRAAFVALVIVATGTCPAAHMALLPFLLIPAIMLFVGAGLLLGILNIVYTDVSRVVAIILQYGVFVSGVIFPLHGSGLLNTINRFNPLSIFIDASRQIAFSGTIHSAVPLAIACAASVVVFLASCRIFYIMEYRVRGIS
jgi:ABC-type polysaccharide/polyol phosphate export permease